MQRMKSQRSLKNKPSDGNDTANATNMPGAGGSDSDQQPMSSASSPPVPRLQNGNQVAGAENSNTVEANATNAVPSDGSDEPTPKPSNKRSKSNKKKNEVLDESNVDPNTTASPDSSDRKAMSSPPSHDSLNEQSSTVVENTQSSDANGGDPKSQPQVDRSKRGKNRKARSQSSPDTNSDANATIATGNDNAQNLAPSGQAPKPQTGAQPVNTENSSTTDANKSTTVKSGSDSDHKSKSKAAGKRGKNNSPDATSTEVTKMTVETDNLESQGGKQVDDADTPDTEKSRETTQKKRPGKALENEVRKKQNAKILDEAGDILVLQRDLPGAGLVYNHACSLWKKNIIYREKCVAAYLKCKFYDEAIKAANNTLGVNPKAVKISYYRGLAKLEKGTNGFFEKKLVMSAKLDFLKVLKLEPDHEEALANIKRVEKHLQANEELKKGTQDCIKSIHNGPDVTSDEGGPPPEDSTGRDNEGNGITCLFYNKFTCRDPLKCNYSHAEDEKSVQDDSGRNVCLYFLANICLLCDEKCFYRHSKEDLDPEGWWHDPEQVKARIIENRKKNAQRKMVVQHLEPPSIVIKKKKARKARKRASVVDVDDIYIDTGLSSA